MKITFSLVGRGIFSNPSELPPLPAARWRYYYADGGGSYSGVFIQCHPQTVTDQNMKLVGGQSGNWVCKIRPRFQPQAWANPSPLFKQRNENFAGSGYSNCGSRRGSRINKVSENR